jgi:hypothetical protein
MLVPALTILHPTVSCLASRPARSQRVQPFDVTQFPNPFVPWFPTRSATSVLQHPSQRHHTDVRKGADR